MSICGCFGLANLSFKVQLNLGVLCLLQLVCHRRRLLNRMAGF